MMTILSGLIGAVSGITQNVIEKKQERKAENEKYDKLLQLEDLNIKKMSLQNQNNLQISDANTFDSFAKTIAQINAPLSGKYLSERIANFIVALTRPIITLMLLIATIIFSLKYGFENKKFILETIFSTLDYTIAYWFVRRSFEKKNI